MTDQPPILDHDRVDRPEGLRVAEQLIEQRRHRRLVRHGDVGSHETEPAQARDRRGQVRRRHWEGHVGHVEPQVGEGRVVQRRRE